MYILYWYCQLPGYRTELLSKPYDMVGANWWGAKLYGKQAIFKLKVGLDRTRHTASEKKYYLFLFL